MNDFTDNIGDKAEDAKEWTEEKVDGVKEWAEDKKDDMNEGDDSREDQVEGWAEALEKEKQEEVTDDTL